MIFLQDMAKDNSSFPVLNGDVKHWEGACVGPTSITNCEPNFTAFTQDESGLLDLVPPSVMTNMKDKSNWSNRLSAANEIERILKQPSTAITTDSLKKVVELILTSMGDTQFKVSQKGLQVMVQLIAIVGKRILPFLPALTPKVLTKMSSTKGDLKKLGMELFTVLMKTVGPAKVITEVSSCGLAHKTSRVREESINVVILGLLFSQTCSLPLCSVARELVPRMVDTKPKVRQAAFEAIALLTSKLDDSEFEQVIILVGEVHTRYKSQHLSDLSLMDAYYARLERHSVPSLDEQGRVQYSVAPINPDGSISQNSLYQTGADVDWIIAPLLSTGSSPQALGAVVSGRSSQRPSSPPSFRPYRSAGKRPWEVEDQSEVTSTNSPAPPTFSMEPPTRQNVLCHLSQRTPTTSSNPSAPSVVMKLPGSSYVDQHLMKQAKANATPPVIPNHMPAVNPSGHHPKPRSSKNFFVHVASMNGRDPQCSVPHQDPPPVPVGGEGSLSSPDESPSSMAKTWPRATLCLSGTPSRVPSVLSARSGGTALSSVAPLQLKSPQINADTISLVESQNSVKTSFSRPHSKPRVRNPLSSLKRSSQAISLGQGGGGALGGMALNQDSSATQVEQDFLRGVVSTPHHWTEQSIDEDYFAIPEDNTILNSSLSASLSSLCNKDSDPEVDRLKHIRKEAANRKAQILSTGLPSSGGPEGHQVPGQHMGHLSGGSSNPSHHLEPTSPSYNKPFSMPPIPSSELAIQKNKKHPPLAHLEAMTPAVHRDKISLASFENKSSAHSHLDKITPLSHIDTKSPLSHLETKPPLETKMPLARQDSRQPVPLPKKWNSFEYGKEDKTYSQAYIKKLASTPAKSLKPPPSQKLTSLVPDEGITTGDVNSISLEGRGLDQSGFDKPRDSFQIRRKSKKDHAVPSRGRTSISTSLFQEGTGERRPTIERGGTNTISMEVSGVGSRNSAELNQHPSQPNTIKTKDVISPNLKLSFSDSDTKKKSRSAIYPNNHESPLVVEEADESSGGITAISSAPIDTTHKRNKKKKPSQTSSPQKLPRDKTSLHNKNHTYVWNESDQPPPSGGMGGALMEMDLVPLEALVRTLPDQAVKTALQSLAKEDWNDKCEGIGMVVIIARDFPHLLQSQLHPVLMALKKEVKNLRSSVAKKATECLVYLFSMMKRAMEADLDQMVQVLLHKSGETNTFLREGVEKALSEMVSNVSLSKAILALLSGGMAHRNTQIRKQTAKYVCAAIELHEPSKYLHCTKEVLEKSLPALIQFTKDSSPDCRYYGRKSLSMLLPEPDFYHVAGRVLKNELYSEAKEIVEMLKVKGVGDPPVESKSHPSSTSSSRHPTGGANRVPNTSFHDGHYQGNSSPNSSSSPSVPSVDTPKKLRKQLSQPGHGRDSNLLVSSPTVHLSDGVLEHLQSSSWNERLEAISQLEEYVLAARPPCLSAHLQRVFDAFTSRLTDRNSKVTLRALQAFENMVPIVPSALVPIINNVVSTLVNNLASRNATLHSKAMTVLDLLSDHIDAVNLIPSVANSSQFGNARVQPIMTKRLASLTKLAYRHKPQLVCRQVLPVVWHHVCAKTPIKGEARLALQGLCSVLQECMQQAFLDSAAHLSVEDNMKLKELLDWDGSCR